MACWWCDCQNCCLCIRWLSWLEQCEPQRGWGVRASPASMKWHDILKEVNFRFISQHIIHRARDGWWWMDMMVWWMMDGDLWNTRCALVTQIVKWEPKTNHVFLYDVIKISNSLDYRMGQKGHNGDGGGGENDFLHAYQSPWQSGCNRYIYTEIHLWNVPIDRAIITNLHDTSPHIPTVSWRGEESGAFRECKDCMCRCWRYSWWAFGGGRGYARGASCPPLSSPKRLHHRIIMM